MKLKKDVKLVTFLQEARLCTGEVYYKTDEGDVLNLKSQLSQYIFLAAMSSGRESTMPEGRILCDLQEDCERLKAFLEG